MSSLPIFSKEGKKTDKAIDLPKEIFETPVNTNVIHQAVLMYQAALRESLNAKFKSKELMCLEDIHSALSKTKEFAKILSTLKLKGKVLAILDGSDVSITRVSRNLPFFNLVRSEDVNAYDILRNKNLLVTETAFDKLLKRIAKI